MVMRGNGRIAFDSTCSNFIISTSSGPVTGIEMEIIRFCGSFNHDSAAERIRSQNLTLDIFEAMKPAMNPSNKGMVYQLGQSLRRKDHGRGQRQSAKPHEPEQTHVGYNGGCLDFMRTMGIGNAIAWGTLKSVKQCHDDCSDYYLVLADCRWNSPHSWGELLRVASAFVQVTLQRTEDRKGGETEHAQGGWTRQLGKQLGFAVWLIVLYGCLSKIS